MKNVGDYMVIFMSARGSDWSWANDLEEIIFCDTKEEAMDAAKEKLLRYVEDESGDTCRFVQDEDEELFIECSSERGWDRREDICCYIEDDAISVADESSEDRFIAHIHRV